MEWPLAAPTVPVGVRTATLAVRTELAFEGLERAVVLRHLLKAVE